MADIAKCHGIGCPIKEDCYRYTAKRSDYQTFLSVTPYNYKNKNCDLFWKDTITNWKEIKTARDIYSENKNSWYDYQPIINVFGEIIHQVDDNNYTGDTRVFYKRNDKYGYLIFGWGSCSGCDALQACSNIDQVQELMDSLQNNILWFDSLFEIQKHFDERDWEASYFFHQKETQDFIEFVKNYTE